MTCPNTHIRSRTRNSGVALMLLITMGLLLLARVLQPAWAQPHQSGLNQSLATTVMTPTVGPSATATGTPATGVVRKLLQEGRDGYAGTSDTYINSYLPTTHITDRSRLKLKGPDAWSPLVRFDLTNQIPAGATVVAAELVFFVESNERLRTLDVGAFRLQRTWDPAWVTWNNATNTDAWGLPGANHVSLDRLGTADDVRTFAYRGVYYGFNVTNSVIYWLQNPSKNFGWVIKGVSSSTGEFDLLSSLSSTPQDRRPILRIDYLPGTPPTTTPTATPTITPTPHSGLTNDLYALAFNDLNGNGLQDTGEPGLGGVLAELSSLTYTSLQRGLTASNGYAALGHPVAQDYRLSVHVPWGYYPTTLTSVRVTYSGVQLIVKFGVRSGRSLALPMIER